MGTKSGMVLWAFDDEIRQKGILDFIKSHTSFLKPLHFHEGELILSDHALRFDEVKKGEDNKSTEILQHEVIDLHLGFDDVFHRVDDRSLGFGMDPLRITFKRNTKEIQMYVFMEHDRVTRKNKNKEWFIELKKWASSNPSY